MKSRQAPVFARSGDGIPGGNAALLGEAILEFPPRPWSNLRPQLGSTAAFAPAPKRARPCPSVGPAPTAIEGAAWQRGYTEVGLRWRARAPDPSSTAAREVAMRPLRSLLSTRAPGATVLVRLLLAGVFLSEGIQKFVFPAQLGVGRFAKIGIPAPQVMAPFVGCVEIVGGALLVVGVLTRLAAIALAIDMLVAIGTTKIPLWEKSGFWAMAHEARTDWSMLLGALFLLWVGAGPWSLDARLAPHREGVDG